MASCKRGGQTKEPTGSSFSSIWDFRVFSETDSSMYYAANADWEAELLLKELLFGHLCTFQGLASKFSRDETLPPLPETFAELLLNGPGEQHVFGSSCSSGRGRLSLACYHHSHLFLTVSSPSGHFVCRRTCWGGGTVCSARDSHCIFLLSVERTTKIQLSALFLQSISLYWWWVHFDQLLEITIPPTSLISNRKVDGDDNPKFKVNNTFYRSQTSSNYLPDLSYLWVLSQSHVRMNYKHVN